MLNLRQKNSLQFQGIRKLILTIFVVAGLIGLTGFEIISYQENSTVDSQLKTLKEIYTQRFLEKSIEWGNLATAYKSSLTHLSIEKNLTEAAPEIEQFERDSKINHFFNHFSIYSVDGKVIYSNLPKDIEQQPLTELWNKNPFENIEVQSWLIKDGSRLYKLQNENNLETASTDSQLYVGILEKIKTEKSEFFVLFLKQITSGTFESMLFPDTHLAAIVSKQKMIQTFTEPINSEINDYEEFDIGPSEYHIITNVWGEKLNGQTLNPLNMLILAKEPIFATRIIFYLILGVGSLLFLVAIWLILGRWVTKLVGRITSANEHVIVLRKELDSHTIMTLTNTTKDTSSTTISNQVDEIDKLEQAITQTFNEIKLQDDFLNKLLNNIHGGILVESPERNILFANTQFGELFKIPFDLKQLLGLSCIDLAQQQVSIFKEGQKFLDRVAIILEKKEIVHQEKIELTDGRFFSRDFIPINFNTGVGFIWIYKDITSMVNFEIEKEINQMKNVSSAKLSSLGEMAGGVAHEINNPLAVIMTRVQLLQKVLNTPGSEAQLLEKLPGNLDMIYKTSERISKIVKGLRSIVRNSENDPFTETSIQQIVEDVNSISQEKLKMKLIKYSFIGTDNPAIIKCRASQIAQVLLNLMNNSVDAIEQSESPWIEVALTEIPKGFRVSVIDSGPGIPNEIATKLMQPFFTTKEVGKGTGLGLSISKGLIESHNGKFYYDETSKNTRFVFELPKDPEAK